MTMRVDQITPMAIEYGKVLLADRPALYPFAVVMLPNGEKSMMSFNFEQVPPEEVEARLVTGLAQDATDGAIVAVGWGYTVDIKTNQGTLTALKVLSEARGEPCRTTYVLYEMQGGGPVFGTQLEGPARAALVFRGGEPEQGTGKGAALQRIAEDLSTGSGKALPRSPGVTSIGKGLAVPQEDSAGRAAALLIASEEMSVGRGRALQRPAATASPAAQASGAGSEANAAAKEAPVKKSSAKKSSAKKSSAKKSSAKKSSAKKSSAKKSSAKRSSAKKSSAKKSSAKKSSAKKSSAKKSSAKKSSAKKAKGKKGRR